MTERTIRRYAERNGLKLVKARPTNKTPGFYLLVNKSGVIAASSRLADIAEKVAA